MQCRDFQTGLAFIVLLCLVGRAHAEAVTTKVPLLLDTDIGDDVDDAFALALALSSPELDVRGITTVADDAHTRAALVCRLLHAVGRADIPVASGRPARDPPDFRGQLQYGLRPAFRKRPERELAADFLYKQLKARPGELTLLALGPLTNVSALLAKHPDCKPWIKRIVIMGGALRVGYENKPPAVAEWNVKSDIKGGQSVFTSGIPLVVAPLDATTNLKLEGPMLQRVLRAGTPLANQLRALYQLWDKPTPTLFDPVAVALCFEEKFCRMRELRLEVDDNGITRVVEGKPNARVATSIQREEFLQWFVERVAGTPQGEVAARATKPMNIPAPVERGGMPNRIHVIEDYETDIERRWWLCGKLEAKNVPPDGKRACRGVLTNDFDDLMGDPMYTAVIFNPVPGPPMGKNTRLSFRYWLKGTDKLRVQIYSLSNGYHRHLTLTDLPQGKWQSAAVDMTAARRPDASGGPLSEGERIDDIQFYTDPSAELIIDDIVLYDAARPSEKRPFPKRPVFTAWFDTGRQGKEWPGHFEIVELKPPLKGKAAKSVNGRLSLSLRGGRPMGENPHLQLRYHLTGAQSLELNFFTEDHNHILRAYTARLNDLKKNDWAELTVDLAKQASFRRKQLMRRETLGEINFEIEAGAELLVDDVLLYEPGDSGKR